MSITETVSTFRRLIEQPEQDEPCSQITFTRGSFRLSAASRSSKPMKALAPAATMAA